MKDKLKEIKEQYEGTNGKSKMKVTNSWFFARIKLKKTKLSYV